MRSRSKVEAPELAATGVSDRFATALRWRTYRLRIFLDAKYPGIISRAAGAMQATRGSRPGTVTRGNCVEVYLYWHHWPCLLSDSTAWSTDIQGIFREACDRIEVRWTAAPQVTYVSRKPDVARLDEFIGPKE